MPKAKDFEWSITLACLLTISTFVAVIVIFVLSAIVLNVSTYLRLRETKNKFSKKLRVIGFFHPNCDAGAGGEKVLWSAVQALQIKSINNDERL